MFRVQIEIRHADDGRVLTGGQVQVSSVEAAEAILAVAAVIGQEHLSGRSWGIQQATEAFLKQTLVPTFEQPAEPVLPVETASHDDEIVTAGEQMDIGGVSLLRSELDRIAKNDFQASVRNRLLADMRMNGDG